MIEKIPDQVDSNVSNALESIEGFKKAVANQETAFGSLKSEEGRFLGDVTLRLTKASMGVDLEKDV